MGFGSESNNAKEIGLIWERFTPVERQMGELVEQIKTLKDSVDELTIKTAQPSEDAATAKSAANSATAYRTRIRKMNDEMSEHLNNAYHISHSLEEILKQSQQSENSVNNSNEKINELYEKIEGISVQVNDTQKNIQDNVTWLNEAIEENIELPSQIENVKENISTISDLEVNASGIVKKIATFHSKVKELHNEILGYNSEDEDGKSIHIDGLKEELAESYSNLQSEYEKLKESIEGTKTDTDEFFEDFKSKSKTQLDDLISEHKTQHDDAYDQIMTLLPTALTAGLASAYEDKVTNEVEDLENHKSTFKHSIIGLVIVSLIPFAIDTYLLLFLQKDLMSVIADTPKLILSILPLYLPILWIAHSSNKKVNLSKRLIEEYTHKGVLSKTFEGLSREINELEDNEASKELRQKLLFNLLTVNAENPGKLISNYKVTDHPLMDALDKSMKLGTAIEKLHNLPGFGGIVRRLERKQKIEQTKAQVKADVALDNTPKQNTETSP